MITTIFLWLVVVLRILANPLANVFQKQLTAHRQHPLRVSFLTYVLLSVLCVPVAFAMPASALPTTFWLYAVLGGLAGAVGNGFLVMALQKGDLSVLGPINAYKPVVSLVVGMLLLAERPSLWALPGTALIIYGSYFVLGTAGEKRTWALFKKNEIRLRVWAMLLSAMEAVFVKKVILASSVALAFVSWCWGGAFFSLLFLLANRVPLQPKTGSLNRAVAGRFFYLILCIGIMQATTNYAFAHMPVGYALSLFQLSVLVSVLLGQRFFNEKDTRKKLIGAAIMLAGAVVIILTG